MSRQLPLVVVLGATACGKSKLAIELARKFGGEIISADSMQVYHGLDIVTNKVTEEEQQQAKHHMINFLDPMQRYSVVDFKNKALSIIEHLQSKNSLPIVVGGTNYYIESLLWKSFIQPRSPPRATQPTDSDSSEAVHQKQDRISDIADTLMDEELKLLGTLSKDSLHSEEDLDDIDIFFAKPIFSESFSQIPSRKLWEILEQVDPVSAHLFHPNDKRRIIRSLQIIQQKKQNYSDLLKDINKSSHAGQSSLGGPLRFEPTCVLWLSCDKSELDQILDERIDSMLERGLLAELEKFHSDYNKQRLNSTDEPDYRKGIFQTIGFKEFHDYLILDDTTKRGEEGIRILEDSIKNMKISTRRYARVQLKWIRRRFLQLGTRDLPPIFKLNTSFNEEHWRKQVSEPTIKIVESFIKRQPLEDLELLSLKMEPHEQSAQNTPAKFNCDICDRLFIGSLNIQQHLKSRNHERQVSSGKRKKQKLDSEALTQDVNDTIDCPSVSEKVDNISAQVE